MSEQGDNFWVQTIEDKYPGFLNSINYNLEGLFSEYANSVVFDVEVPSQSIELAYSQMFFDEPWCNILYEDEKLEKELSKGCQKYIDKITSLHGDPAFKTEEIMSNFSEDQINEWLFCEDLEAFYYLTEGSIFWKTDQYYLFLSLTKEDKELPYELIMGRVLIKDLLPLLVLLKNKFNLGEETIGL